MPSYTVANPLPDHPVDVTSMVSAIETIRSRGLLLSSIEMTEAEFEMLKAQAAHWGFAPSNLLSTFMDLPINIKA